MDIGSGGKAQRSVIALLAVASALLALLLLLPASAAEEVRDTPPWASLALAEGQSADVIASGDLAVFDLSLSSGGLGVGEELFLVIDPLPQGWDYRISEGTGTQLGYQVPDRGNLTLEVELAYHTEPGDYTVEPRLERFSEPGTLAALQLRITVPSYHLDLALEGSLHGVPAEPGDRVIGALSTSHDSPLSREVVLSQGLAPSGWVMRPTQPTIQVSPGSEVEVEFVVDVGNMALPGSYTVVVEAASPDPRFVRAYLEVEFAVDEVREVRVQALPGTLMARISTVEGRAVPGEIIIVNTGNAPARVEGIAPPKEESAVLPEGWSTTCFDLPAYIGPFEHLTVTLNVLVPEDPVLAPAGDHVLRLKVISAHGGEDTKFDLTVHVVQERGLAILPEDGNSGDITVDVNPFDPFGGEATVLVRDLGNGLQRRRVDLTAEHSIPVESVRISPSTMYLSQGMERTVTVRVVASEDAVPGHYTIWLQTSDGQGGEARVPVSVRVYHVTASMASELLMMDLAENATSDWVEMDSQYVVQGTVTNDGNETVAFAHVNVYDSTKDGTILLGRVPIVNLSVGESRTFAFQYDASEDGDHILEANLDLPGAAPWAQTKATTEQAVGSEEVPSPWGGLALPLLLGTVIGAMTGLLAVLGTEAGRFALITLLLLPLYTRLKKEQVVDQFVRGQILGYVKANPGETYTSIKKALRLSNGQFVYHSRVLETQGLIKSVKDGANRRFYPSEMSIPREVKDVKLNQVQRIIYTIILEYPGISQGKIAKLVKLAPSTVSYHVNIMSKVGVIERKRSGRLTICFATGDIE